MKNSTFLAYLWLSAVPAAFLPGSALAQCGGNQVIVSILTDGNGDQTTWEILNMSDAVLATGGPYTGMNFTQVNDTACLGSAPGNTCYKFRVMDSFGDGLSGVGNWKLISMDGKLLMGDDFPTGSVSPANPPEMHLYVAHSFCLPTGPANISNYECGVFTSTLNEKVHCNSVPGADKYQFEFSDPDAGFVRRIKTQTPYVRFNQVTEPRYLTPGVHYFCRVRSNANGFLSQAHWGSGCEVGLGLAEVVHCTPLISAPAYGHSCNETRAFGSPAYSFIYAKPVLGATAYTFHIYIPNEPAALDTMITRSTYILQLKWPGTPMVQGSTYNVDVKTTVNGLESEFCAPSCTITIDNAYVGGQMAPVEAGIDGTVQLWPNPVSNGVVNLALTDLVDAEQRIEVKVYDVHGKQLMDQGFNNTGGSFSTRLELPELADGVYLAHITVNGKAVLQRLTVVH